MKLDSLESQTDDELLAVIDRANALLKERDRQRKEKAIEQARAILSGAGLNLKDVAAGRLHRPGNGKSATLYRAGQQYQHPANKALVWNGKGQKPNWLRQVEAEGGKAIELEAANDNVPPSVRKAG